MAFLYCLEEDLRDTNYENQWFEVIILHLSKNKSLRSKVKFFAVLKKGIWDRVDSLHYLIFELIYEIIILIIFVFLLK